MTRGVVLLFAVWAPSAVAQSVPTVKVTKPDATFAEPFSSVMGLRELADGRVIVSDRLERTVALVDLASGDLTPIGHEGQGPGEHAMPGPLFPLPGDSTLLVDFAAMRGLVLAEGAIGRTVSFAAAGGLPLIPSNVDGRGRIYGSLPSIGGPGSESAADSTPIARLDSRTGVIDTAGWLPAAQGGRVVAMRGSSGGKFNFAMRPYAPRDAWAVAPDGRIAVVHAADYHVEWIGTNGARRAGAPLSYTPVKIGTAEKNQWADAMSGATMIMRVAGGSGGGTPPAAMRPPRPNIDELDWPEYKPPFESQSVAVAPDGTLWIRLSQPANAKTPLYDVVDANGNRIRQVALPEGRRLVAFGKGTIYTVRRDADDLEWLERYRLP
jgi:hypothetical protein